MITFLRHNIEYVLLIALYVWIGFCSILNMGSLAGVVFLILVAASSKISTRSSICVLIALLYSSLASLNLPSPIVITSAVIILFNFSRFRYKYKGIIIRKLLVPFIIYLAIRLLSILIIKDTSLYSYAINTDIITLMCVIVTIGLVEDKLDVDFIARWFGIIGVLATALGFLYYTFNDSAYLGQLYSSSTLADKGVIGENPLMQAWLRWVPVDKDPNFWAANLLFPLAYWLNKVSREIKMVSLICLTITFLGIFGTYSRSTFMISLIMLLVTLFRSSPKYVFVFCAVIMLVFIGVKAYFPTFVERVFTIQDNIKESGGSSRFFLWGEALDNFLSSPIWGIGAGQTQYYSALKLGSHNLFLQILGETGILGFTCFAKLWFYPLMEMRKLEKIDNFFFFALLGFTINSMTIHNFDLRLPFFIIIMFYVKFLLLNRIEYLSDNKCL